MPTFSATGKGYGNLWDQAAIKMARRKEVEWIADKAIQNKRRYMHVEHVTGCPWYVIAAIHMREGSMNFGTHLHEGSSLSGRTKNVPKGRPKTGTPPFTWEESAVDALTVAPHDMRKVGRWSVERMLYELEKYNGWGYMGRTNSPYVWAGTNVYSSGKYIRDGVFDPTYVDTQQGCVAIIKAIAEKDAMVADRLKDREAKPPKEIIDAEKKNGGTAGKVITGAGAGTGVATGGSEIFAGLPPEILGIGIGVGVALAMLGLFLWWRSHKTAEKKVTELWLGDEMEIAK